MSCNPDLPGAICKSKNDIDDFVGHILIEPRVVETKIDFDVYDALPVSFVETRFT